MRRIAPFPPFAFPPFNSLTPKLPNYLQPTLPAILHPQSSILAFSTATGQANPLILTSKAITMINDTSVAQSDC